MESNSVNQFATEQPVIGFIGAGNMAESLIRGLLAEGNDKSAIWAADLDASKLGKLASDCGIRTATNEEVAKQVDIIVLAVKPQVMEAVCRELCDHISNRSPLIISIAAGITVKHLSNWLGNDKAIVRCMPNTPALVGKGASGLYANQHVTSEQKTTGEKLIAAVGVSVWVEQESDIDSITALSGSGPAYFFLFMEAMQKSAVAMGIPEDVAKTLTYQTALGAAELAIASEDSTEQLRFKVTSPGGTTEQAINQFQAGDLTRLVDTALNAARTRSIELAEQLGDN